MVFGGCFGRTGRLEVLGVPIGPDDVVERKMGKLVEQAKKKLGKFTLLPNKHRAATALHYGATSLMTHFIRTCRVPQSLIQDLDDAMWDPKLQIPEEFRNLEPIWRKLNKASLDQTAMRRENRALMAENSQLQAAMKSYLERLLLCIIGGGWKPGLWE